MFGFWSLEQADRGVGVRDRGSGHRRERPWWVIGRGGPVVAFACCALLIAPASAEANMTVFSYTGAEQMFTVPAGVLSLHVVAIGGAGGPVGSTSALGAQATADLSVTPGEVLYVEVGGNGGASTNLSNAGVGGFNGGGDGGVDGTPNNGAGAGGGGASDVRTTSSSQQGTLDSRVIVAGGGGGGSGFAGAGGPAGQAGTGHAPGGPGTASAGGTAGGGAGAGALGVGGAGEADSSCCVSGGGGGGGLYGGGGGGQGSTSGGGGGGGSSGFGTGTSNTSVVADTSGTPSITFTYTVTTYGLTVHKAGTGAGTVTSSPAGITCGATCSHTYSAGTAVKLTAKAASGSQFAGWSGACTGTGACNLTMSAAKTATATFKKAIPTPNTTITGENISSAKHRASFSFSGSGGVGALHFQCKLDATAWKPCSSPQTYTALAHGSHTFEVRAIDAHGTADPTPAKLTFPI
jgi:Divergent InlB B-repeat domain/Glycine rich protein